MYRQNNVFSLYVIWENLVFLIYNLEMDYDYLFTVIYDMWLPFL